MVATGLRRTLGERAVLDGVDLRVDRGEVIAVLGRVGAGTSTLLRTLDGLDHRVDGALLVSPQRELLTTDPGLTPWRRALRTVARDRVERNRAADLLRAVGLEGYEHTRPTTLTAGEQQRVALARALASNPRLLLLDEPLVRLDALTRAQLHALILEVVDDLDCAVVLATKDVDEALALADRVLVLDHGRITFEAVVDIHGPRRRSLPRYGELRSLLLSHLGVDESAGCTRRVHPN